MSMVKSVRRLNSNVLRNLFFATVAALLLPGCDSVVIDQPIGDSLTLGQKKDLCGRWVDDEWNFADIRLTKKGDLIGGSLMWDEDTESYTTNGTPLEVRVVGANRFLYMKADTYFMFYLLKHTGDTKMTLINPDPDRFKEAVEQKQLDGTVTKTDENFHVVLQSESEKIRTVLADAKVQELFPKKGLYKLRRVKRFDDE